MKLCEYFPNALYCAKRWRLDTRKDEGFLKKNVKLKIGDKNLLEIRKLFIFILGEKSNMWLIISNQIIVWCNVNLDNLYEE